MNGFALGFAKRPQKSRDYGQTTPSPSRVLCCGDITSPLPSPNPLIHSEICLIPHGLFLFYVEEDKTLTKYSPWPSSKNLWRLWSIFIGQQDYGQGNQSFLLIHMDG